MARCTASTLSPESDPQPSEEGVQHWKYAFNDFLPQNTPLFSKTPSSWLYFSKISRIICEDKWCLWSEVTIKREILNEQYLNFSIHYCKLQKGLRRAQLQSSAQLQVIEKKMGDWAWMSSGSTKLDELHPTPSAQENGWNKTHFMWDD